jgi:threonine/homoserine/homoserine lactone efflux protein
MFDARYFAFLAFAALLVVSPGATLAVVTEAAIGEGRVSALYTVAGVGIGNSSLALASALGMSVVFARWPSTLQVVKTAGAIYLAYLGLRGLWFAFRPRAVAGAGREPDAGPTGPASRGARGEAGRPGHSGAVVRGVTTNLLNPPVILFYMTLLPQFIGPHDPFFARFLVLAGSHVLLSLAWLTFYAAALGVLADRLARPLVRRTLEGLTGAVLVGLGARLLVR